MYFLRPGIKKDPQRRWELRDRVFFACGACHILAYAFLAKYPSRGFRALWIKPQHDYTGNHILAADGDTAFDYHGYSSFEVLIDHTHTKARRWWPGWTAEVIPLPTEVLISEAKSREYEGLWLREPGQFLHNAMPRAERFLDRYGEPPLRP